jgi:4-hydroxybenzoate polyprenyltransferase
MVFVDHSGGLALVGMHSEAGILVLSRGGGVMTVNIAPLAMGGDPAFTSLAQQRRSDEEDARIPLCVDMDGTLVLTDTLWEALFAFLRRRPLMVFVLPFWLLLGRAGFKARLAENVTLAPDTLPYRTDLLAFLRAEHARGRKLFLVTAANHAMARAVGQHVGIFSDIIGSDHTHNLKGENKADYLCRIFGRGNFDYAGDSRADIAVWRAARRAILAGPSAGLMRHALWETRTPRLFPAMRGGARAYLRAMRPHQWIKNTLIFLPVLAAHAITPGYLLSCVIAFMAFSLVASAGYILNDLMDLSADRAHPRKRKRPFASGAIAISHGVLLMAGLLIAGFGLAATLSPMFIAWVGVYLALTLSYSFWLKRRVLIDVFVLAALYTHRIIAGAIATGIEPSFWLLAFSTFFFLSLAMLKRYSELVDRRAENEAAPAGRGYWLDDMDTIVSLGVSSGYVSVMVLALYVNSPAVSRLYRSPELIWLVCPILLYWLSRTWVGAGRGKIHDDPIVFAVRDPLSRNLVILAFSIIALAAIIALPCLPWACK